MKTRITELLGIEYPVIQGGMAWVAEHHLAAAVSEAGHDPFFTGLETELYSAGHFIFVSGNKARHAKTDSCMSIVPASMHQTRMGRRKTIPGRPMGVRWVFFN